MFSQKKKKSSIGNGACKEAPPPSIQRGVQQTLLVGTSAVHTSGNTQPQEGVADRLAGMSMDGENNLCTDDDFDKIAEHIGNNWKQLGRKLGFSDGQLETFRADHHVSGQREVVYQMMRCWRGRSPTGGTTLDLVRILQSVNCCDIANMLPQKENSACSSRFSRDSFNKRVIRKRSKSIPDQHKKYLEINRKLRDEGLESSNIIIGLDFTKSNEWTGEKTFCEKHLHFIDQQNGNLNPYEQVLTIIAHKLSRYDDDGIIPVFGFGDIETKNHSVFPINCGQEYCKGFQEVMKAYRQVVPSVTMSGPTCFAPLIRKAMEIVQDKNEYHILLIIADGQVTTEKATVSAIEEASNYPLSIVMIGVGDGPWDTMKDFDDRLPRRRFDNFQFVNFHEVMENNRDDPEEAFALHTLMEIPEQFKQIKQLGLLNASG